MAAIGVNEIVIAQRHTCLIVTVFKTSNEEHKVDFIPQRSLLFLYQIGWGKPHTLVFLF